MSTDENIDKAKGNPAWSYSFYFDLVKLTALQDDHSAKRTSKNRRTVNAHGTSPARGRGGRNPNPSGRGNNGNDSNSQDKKAKLEKLDKEGAIKANIPYNQYKTLPWQTKVVIHKGNTDPDKVIKKFGILITLQGI